MAIVLVLLSQGKHALIDAEDAKRVSAHKWHAYKSHNRCRHETWYAGTNIAHDGKKTRIDLHRFVLDAPKGMEVDHKNGDGLDCRRRNLRLATKTQNNAHRVGPVITPSGYRGVYKSCQKWRAMAQINGKQTHLGTFDTPEEAAMARDRVVREQYGEFVSLNFPDK